MTQEVIDTIDRLKGFRKSLGITQEGFAKEIGVSRSSWGQIEIYKSGPTLDMLLAIVKKYSISLDYILGVSSEGVPKSVPKSTPNPETKSAEERITTNEKNINRLREMVGESLLLVDTLTDEFDELTIRTEGVVKLRAGNEIDLIKKLQSQLDALDERVIINESELNHFRDAEAENEAQQGSKSA